MISFWMEFPRTSNTCPIVKDIITVTILTGLTKEWLRLMGVNECIPI